MNIKRCDKFSDVLIIEKKKFDDDRGFFTENFVQHKFDSMFSQMPLHFIQDNLSKNNDVYTLRGLHFQYPRWQGKYVTSMNGEVNVVIVDLRIGSETFGQWNRYNIDESKSLYVPEGFAHGFLTLNENVFYYYKNTRYYHKEECYILKWDDSDLDINWGLNKNVLSNVATISEADQNGKSFNDIVELLKD